MEEDSQVSGDEEVMENRFKTLELRKAESSHVELKDLTETSFLELIECKD